MRAPAPLPLRAPGLGRRLTLVTRRVASAGEQPSHAARPGHAVRHPGCGNRERERSLPVTCNQHTTFFLQRLSFFSHSELGIYANNNPKRIERKNSKLDQIVARWRHVGTFSSIAKTPTFFVYIYVQRTRDRTRPVSKLVLVPGDADDERVRNMNATRQRLIAVRRFEQHERGEGENSGTPRSRASVEGSFGSELDGSLDDGSVDRQPSDEVQR